MILALVSDSHGRAGWLKQALPLMKDAELIVHLGDGEKDWKDLTDSLPCPLLQVRGNCDWSSYAPDLLTKTVGGVPCLFTHGHLFSVKHGLDTLRRSAREHAVQLAAFGHTHTPLVDTFGGIVYVNPGSLADTKTIALVTIEDGRITPRILDVPIR